MTPTRAVPKLLTAGVIAAELHEPIHRVLRVLNTRHHIQPRARAGIIRLYDRDALAMVRHEIDSIDARRCNKPSLLTAEGASDGTP